MDYAHINPIQHGLVKHARDRQQRRLKYPQENRSGFSVRCGCGVKAPQQNLPAFPNRPYRPLKTTESIRAWSGPGFLQAPSGAILPFLYFPVGTFAGSRRHDRWQDPSNRRKRLHLMTTSEHRGPLMLQSETLHLSRANFICQPILLRRANPSIIKPSIISKRLAGSGTAVLIKPN